jgi:hypothetical protein
MAIVRPVLGGVVLGLAILAAFAFLGVPTIPTGPALRAALLSAADLPPGFAPEAGPPAGSTACGALADPAAGLPDAVATDQHQAATGVRLWEAIAAPAGDALSRLRAALIACFPGVPEVRAPVADSCWTFPVSGGYVAAGQVGTAAVVLRWLGPARPEDVAVTLRTALAKARRLLG